MGDENIFSELKAFVIGHGGFVDDRLFIGIDPTTGARGLRASSPVPANTPLLRVPGECFLTGITATDGVLATLCEAPQNSIDDLALALNLIEARSQGADSIFNAYIKVHNL